MLTRVQVLIPNDLLEQAKLMAVSRNSSFSKLVTHSLVKEIKPKKKVSVYEAFKALAAKNRNLKKLPKDFATNDKYLYKYP